MTEESLLKGFEKRQVFTVSDVNALVKTMLEGALGELWVEGEVSNYTRAASGHRYFTLKDEKSQIRCVMFRGQASFLRFEPESGMKVLVRAAVTVYEPRGEYQLSVQIIEPAGVGALQLAFEQLKKKLEEEGLFDSALKKPLPFLPRRLGIVTSPSGAAIRDILTVLRRRHPNIHVTIYPALVQGDEAPPQIAEGIRTLDGMGAFDVLIVTRGGGSMEDLWAFNDERVARAIAACRTPVISAVGHERDFTIADFVADLRAPTPSAAAEIVVGRKDQLLETIAVLQRRMAASLTGRIKQVQALLKASSPARLAASVRRLFQTASQKTDDLSRRLALGARAVFEARRRSFSELAAALDALSPLGALRRGYAIATRAGEKEPLSSVTRLKGGDRLDLRLSDGTAGCSVTGIQKEGSVE
jgi:exodeoxyribonuclease VII large subunit